MKKILSFLLTIVFLQSQTFAISGGPFGATGGSVNIIGSYSGVLTPTDTAGDTIANQGENLAALGMFSLGMPDSGIGTGVFVMFTQGEIFNGTITATGDPADGGVRGILEGTFDYVDFAYAPDGSIVNDVTLDAMGNVTSITPRTVTYQAAVRGTLEATVTSTNAPTADQAVSGNFGRIAGTAKMGRIFFVGGGVSVTDKSQFFIVDGVKQSVTNTSAGSVGTQGGTGGGGGGGLLLIL